MPGILLHSLLIKVYLIFITNPQSEYSHCKYFKRKYTDTHTHKRGLDDS